jgi:hypothetical protein
MADIAPTVPSIGEANSTADAKVLAAINTIVSTINALDADNLASGAVTEAKIAAGVVSAAKIKAEAWTSYTATVASTSVTLGTGGTNVARYIQYGKTIHAAGTISIGTGGSFTGTDITIALPAAAATGINFMGNAYAFDSGGSPERILGVAIATAGASTMIFRFGGATADTALGATTPFTWAVSDRLDWFITYEAA